MLIEWHIVNTLLILWFPVNTLLILVRRMDEEQSESWADGFTRSQLIRIYTVSKVFIAFF